MSARARALITIAGAGLLLGATFVGLEAVAVGSALIGILLAIGWSFLIELPNPGTARKVIAGSAIAATLVAYFFTVRELTFLAGFVVIVGFVAEMARKDGRPRLLEQISGTVSGALLALLAALWIRAFSLFDHGAEAVRAVLLAIIVATFLEMLIPHSLRHLRHVVYMAGGFLGALAFLLFADIPWYWASIAGVAAGLIMAVFDSLLRRLPPATRRRPGLALSMVPLCVGALVSYCLGLVLLQG